jgi:hypothetical protein
VRIYVKCERCHKEGTPKRNYNNGLTYPEGTDFFGTIKRVSYITSNDEPPDGWTEAVLLNERHLLCGECATAIDGIIRGAILAVPK